MLLIFHMLVTVMTPRPEFCNACGTFVTREKQSGGKRAGRSSPAFCGKARFVALMLAAGCLFVAKSAVSGDLGQQ